MWRPFDQFLCLVLLFFLFFEANLSLSSSPATQLCSHDEATALIQFKTSFSVYDYYSSCEYAGIKSYPKTESWKESTDCCSWDGVTCDNVKGEVIGLDLSCSWISGSILPNNSVFHLPHLQKLNLAFNDLDFREIPAGRFASLVYLNLSYTGISGKVPSQVSRLSKLVSLDISRNYNLWLDKHTLEGLVQNLTEVRHLFLDEVGMSSINPTVFRNLSSSLRSLSLNHCGLRGKFPENIFHLPNLQLLNLGDNEDLNIPQFNRSSHVKLLDLSHMSLSAELLDSIGNSLSLEHLDMSSVDFPGRLPDSIGNLVSLKYVDMSSADFSGRLPDSIGNLVSLEYLDISRADFSGRLPDSIGNLVSLKYLDISWTNFSGRLPDSIGNLVSLKQLDMSGANFSGRLPDSIGNLVSLKYLRIKYSKICGSIPRSLGNLRQLKFLDLSNNFLTGQIPSSLTNLTQLETLNLCQNQLEGSIPDEVNAFPNLIKLDLSYNLLNGTLPSWLFTIPTLQTIDLSHNQLHGHIKEFQYNSLTVIYFENNELQGPLPSSISQLVNLTYLDLSSNNLSGNVELGMFPKLQNLQSLDLQFNSLSFNTNGTGVDYTLPNLWYLSLSSCNAREFPQFLRSLERLGHLDLSNNRIRGKIPMWMWDVGKDSLLYLNLSHNSLTDFEQLPWDNLLILDLSSNLIHGGLPIPPLGTKIILIPNNRLSGEISSLICNASSLEILDLSQNNLRGIIPQCFGDLSQSMWMLNLQMNKFSGIIPPFAKGCQLSYLNLNGNQLKGPLTRSIINCRELEVLDLGNNKINDTFPHWLGSLPGLQVLVMKSNRMYGSIHGTRSNLSFSKIQIFDLSSNYFTGYLPVRYINNFRAMTNLTKSGRATQYMGIESGNFYSFSVGIVMKGQEFELVKIFRMLTIIDLSNNKFEGEIPEVIGKLILLKGLNLSHNNLSGCIPASIGYLSNLEWLDLCSNSLTGKIPAKLLDLTFLSSLNLSENELVGCIPKGKQFNTFENNSFTGNVGLHGFPLSRDCSNNAPPQLPPSTLLEQGGSNSNIAFGWKIVLIGYGCGVMFGLAVGYVVFRTGKPKWFVTLVENQQRKRRRK